MASMTATDVRDRLDQRFKLLVGSRRDLKRHQTLRHAVQWSYELLNDPEKTLLERCSVFVGGFDLQSACTIGGFAADDDYIALDLLDALVRKSLIAVDRSAAPVFDVGDDPSVRGRATHPPANDSAFRIRGRAGCLAAADIIALWDSPRQRGAGSAASWLIFVQRFGGLPTTTTSIRPPPSPRMQGISVRDQNYEAAWAGAAHRAARLTTIRDAGICYNGFIVLHGRTCRHDSVRFAMPPRLPSEARFSPYGVRATWEADTFTIGEPHGGSNSALRSA
jgi:hypothetical protein